MKQRAPFSFHLQKSLRDSAARAATLHTAHGEIATPVFMPVGTLATVKGLSQRDLAGELNAPILLANAYHLYLLPGSDLLDKAGGLHRFMGWERPILTDSGGFQVHSLSSQRKISEEGVLFRSHRDGSPHLFTPEKSVDMQRQIGADIIMAFDECTPYPCSYTYARYAMERTHRWLTRGQQRFAESTPRHGYRQAFFPIIQGSIYRDLREASAQYVLSEEREGYAIGGVCHPTGQLGEVIDWVVPFLPKEKPRYLMGVGTPEDLLESIHRGDRHV